MVGLLADVNITGQFGALVTIFQSGSWRALWTEMAVSVRTFEELGLSQDVIDSELWNFCQEKSLLLVTGNRNRKGENSLEAEISRSNRPDSLPVITLANPGRILRDRSYAELTAERTLEYLIEIERYRGVGRIYVP